MMTKYYVTKDERYVSNIQLELTSQNEVIKINDFSKDESKALKLDKSLADKVSVLIDGDVTIANSGPDPSDTVEALSYEERLELDSHLENPEIESLVSKESTSLEAILVSEEAKLAHDAVVEFFDWLNKVDEENQKSIDID